MFMSFKLVNKPLFFLPIRYILIPLILLWMIIMTNDVSAKTSPINAYDFSFKTLVGHKDLPLSAYRGKVILIVNTASKCGFTSQYQQLEELYKKYHEQGLVVIGVPSNDFLQQEPGNDQEIANFCQVNYGVTFPMTAKEVVTGKDAHPFYRWAYETLGFGSAPKWNFHKYLIDREGNLITYYYSTTSPTAPRLIRSIEKALADDSENQAKP